jgi:antitoxin component YwqK of YwqJK toxin-antitoxin module
MKNPKVFITFDPKLLVMRRFVVYSVLVSSISFGCYGQEFLKRTYHDKNKKDLKEVYQVQDTVSNVLSGRYISYFVNGNVESRGQFRNNETVGVWEFFYENGNLKMRGLL